MQPTATCSLPIFPFFAAPHNKTAFDTLGRDFYNTAILQSLVIYNVQPSFAATHNKTAFDTLGRFFHVTLNIQYDNTYNFTAPHKRTLLTPLVGHIMCHSTYNSTIQQYIQHTINFAILH